MKKITDFIVNKKYFILIFFIILTAISIVLSSKVNINYEISKYLPNNSETKIGINIMDMEFDNNLSTLNVMVKNSKDDKKYLEKLDHVNKVETKNKDEYTLYVLTLDVAKDSKQASMVYDEIKEYFGDNLVDTSGDVSSYNKAVLPFYIILLAVLSALVILVIMCESYIEPFLFLLSILIAVVLNYGSNIMFSSVSNITSSISAILQMALSMDYSIMLMNRYRQERTKENNKIEAMKEALYNSFKAISSSSVTTIVGLLALVFMSFTIGKDLGFVLAKGVLLSLLSIFTVLPCLILMCDKLIYKTKKKSPIIKLNIVGRISYKCRYIALVLFILIFIASYFLKGNLQIVYTQSGTDEIEDVFTLNNQMAIIYSNKHEDTISKYCQNLDKNKNINSVMCYGNTINMPLKYNELNNKFKQLGKDIQVEDYLLKVVYYHYNNNLENNKIKLNDLLNFIKSDIYNDDRMNKNIDNSIKDNIELLNNFTDLNKLKSARTIKEIATALDISEENVTDLLIYNNSKNITNKLTIKEFIIFMNNYVLTHDKYKNSIDKNTQNNLNNISKFTNKDTLNTKYTSIEMANLFGIDENTVNSLYTYYLINNEIEDKLSLYEFANFTSTLFDSEYGSLFDESLKESINILKIFSNEEFINTEMSIQDIARIFNQDENTLKMLYQILFGKTDIELSPYDFAQAVINSSIYNLLGDKKESLQTVYSIMNSTNNDIKYNYQELSIYLSTLGSKIDEPEIKKIYSFYLSVNLKLTPYEFVDFILSNKNSEELRSIDESTLNLLNQLKIIISGVLNDTKYTAKELSDILNVKEDNLKLIYSLYSTSDNELTISYQDFINLLTSDILKNDMYKDNFDDSSKNKLMLVNTIIEDSINNKKYTKDEVYNLLKELSNNLDKQLIDLIYIYYGSKMEYNDDWTLTIEEFSRYLNEEILTDSRFDTYIDDSMKKNIIDSKESIQDSKKLLVGDKYSRVVINTNLLPESKETFKFIQNTKDNLKTLDEFYVVGDSPMAYEMSKTFNSELNLITILTMIFIFVVVAITFKSILIPVILVLLIECAVFLTMGILSFMGTVYFISILIVQSILMGATIDYAILYTSYYLEARENNDIKSSIIKAYNNSINTILTSALVLIIVTFIVGKFSSEVAAKICMTLSQGTLISALLILILLPAVIASCDRFIVRNRKHRK